MNLSIDYYPRANRRFIAGLFSVLTVVFSVFSPVGSVMSLWFIAVALLSRSELHLNPHDRTYRSVRGLWPFCPNRKGTFGDLKGIVLDRHVTPSSHGPAEVSYTVSLCWVNALEHPFTLDRTRDFADILKSAEFLVKRLHLPLIQGSGMLGDQAVPSGARDRLAALEVLSQRR